MSKICYVISLCFVVFNMLTVEIFAQTSTENGRLGQINLAYEVSTWQLNRLSTLKYDISFRKHTSTYLPSIDWRILKAQCFQESAFNEEAVSPVGAMGLCQFMPGTWDDNLRRANLTGHPFNYDLNIEMAAQYMSRLYGQWSSPRPVEDRITLALASYNAGLGNLLNAQRVCDGPNLSTEIMICLPCVTGHHSKETTQYVYRIWSFYSELVRTDNYE